MREIDSNAMGKQGSGVEWGEGKGWYCHIWQHGRSAGGCRSDAKHSGSLHDDALASSAFKRAHHSASTAPVGSLLLCVFMIVMQRANNCIRALSRPSRMGRLFNKTSADVLASVRMLNFVAWTVTGTAQHLTTHPRAYYPPGLPCLITLQSHTR